MAENYSQEGGERFFSDLNTRLRDLEEKQRLLRDKMLLIGDSFVRERDKQFSQVQELKKTVENLTLEVGKLRDAVVRMREMGDKSARKEDLMILQRQFDLFRED